jgi:hypothetical protein
VNVSGAGAVLVIEPATTDVVHLAALNLASGATATLASLPDHDVHVILISGHTQHGGDGAPHNAAGSGWNGFSAFMVDEYGWHRDEFHLYSEDPEGDVDDHLVDALHDTVDTDHCGGSLLTIVGEAEVAIRAANARGVVPDVVLGGYSHGGGLAYMVARALASTARLDEDFRYTLAFSVYLDAVTQPSEVNDEARERMPETNPPLTAIWLVPERRLPERSQYHLNLYQSNIPIIWPFARQPWGASTVYEIPPGVTVNQKNLDQVGNTTSHYDIHKHDVLGDIVAPEMARVVKGQRTW